MSANGFNKLLADYTEKLEERLKICERKVGLLQSELAEERKKRGEMEKLLEALQQNVKNLSELQSHPVPTTTTTPPPSEPVAPPPSSIATISKVTGL